MSVPASYMLSCFSFVLFVVLIIFIGGMNGFQIAQQAPHKKDLAFQTRELMLKHCGSNPPNQLKYLSPWSAKGHSWQYQSSEKQHEYEFGIAMSCKIFKEKSRMQGWYPAEILTWGWQNFPRAKVLTIIMEIYICAKTLCLCSKEAISLLCPSFPFTVFFFKHSSSSKQHVSTTLDPEPYWKPQVLHDRMKLHCVHKQLMQSLKADTMLGSMTNCINQTASREGILCYEHHKKGDDII